MINLKIFLPNNVPFQIENHVQRIHLCVFYIYGKRRFETSKNELFPLFSLAISWRILKSLSSLAPSNPASGNFGCDMIDGLKDGRDASAN